MKYLKTNDFYIAGAIAIVGFLILIIGAGTDTDTILLGLVVFVLLFGAVVAGFYDHRHFKEKAACPVCGARNSYKQYKTEQLDERFVEELRDYHHGKPCQPFYVHGSEVTNRIYEKCSKCGEIRSYDESYVIWND